MRPRSTAPATDLEELVGADEELIAGRRPVEEAFVARRDAHRLLVVPSRREALERLVLHATNLRIPVVEVEGGTLTALAGFDGHQGVALVVGPRRYATTDDVLALAARRDEPPFVLVLDSLEDPQNVGSLLRSAEAAGVHGVIFPTHRQAPLTPAAVKASSGAVEHLLLAPVDDLPGALADLHIRGVRIVGSEADAPLTARQTDLRGPVAIVVGSEGQGLGPAVRRRSDAFMRIPMVGAVGSLNAAVAGSILVFEAAVQRDPEGTRARRRPETIDELLPAGSAERTAGRAAGPSDDEAAPEAVADEADGPEAREEPDGTERTAELAEQAPDEPEPTSDEPEPSADDAERPPDEPDPSSDETETVEGPGPADPSGAEDRPGEAADADPDLLPGGPA